MERLNHHRLPPQQDPRNQQKRRKKKHPKLKLLPEYAAKKLKMKTKKLKNLQQSHFLVTVLIKK